MNIIIMLIVTIINVIIINFMNKYYNVYKSLFNITLVGIFLIIIDLIISYLFMTCGFD